MVTKYKIHPAMGIARLGNSPKVENRLPELLDRQTDPEQLHNIAGNPNNRTLIDRLEEELQRQIREVEITPEAPLQA